MSNSKTPITILQEFCAKKNRNLPKYDYCDEKQLEHLGWTYDIPEDLVNMKFFCKCEALNLESFGGGLSKKDSKHSAATYLLKQLQATNDEDQSYYANINNVQSAASSIFTDAISTLLDICIQRTLPKAEFQEIESTGPSHAPSFTIQCKISSLTTRGKSQSKKSAKQIAASEMLKKLEKIHPDCEKKIVTLEQCAKIDDRLTKNKIENYLAYRNAEDKDKPALGVLIKDRHNFYTSTLDEEVKEKVVILLKDEELYDAEKIKQICAVLEYDYEMDDVLYKNKPLKIFDLFIEFGKFSSVIIDDHAIVSHNVIEYFKVMFNVSTLIKDNDFLKDNPNLQAADFLTH